MIDMQDLDVTLLRTYLFEDSGIEAVLLYQLALRNGRLALRTNHSPVTEISHRTWTASQQAMSLAYEMNDNPPIAPLRSLHDQFDDVKFIIRDFYPWQPDSYPRGTDDAGTFQVSDNGGLIYNTIEGSRQWLD